MSKIVTNCTLYNLYNCTNCLAVGPFFSSKNDRVWYGEYEKFDLFTVKTTFGFEDKHAKALKIKIAQKMVGRNYDFYRNGRFLI